MEIPEYLYQQIVSSMPIVCVDLLIRNKFGHVLLLKRRNSPAKDQWWFPGGRVLLNEKRSDAVRRKAKQECGLTLPENLHLKGTFELFFYEGGANFHSITTLFECGLDGDQQISLDDQSFEYKWVDQVFLNKYQLHDFITNSIN